MSGMNETPWRAQGQDAACSAPVGECERLVDITPERITLLRRIAGFEKRVNVPTQSYRGVTLKADGGTYEVSLSHLDRSLDVLLLRAADDGDVIATWRGYGRATGLPLLIEDAEGRFQPFEDQRQHGPAERRFGSPLKLRRPRFLARRAAGHADAGMVHRGEAVLTGPA
jgi:Family of unknown function (DUF6101)